MSVCNVSYPAVILAGGLGTRLREETETRPKPMVEVGGRPILWHIMKFYSFFGVNEFVICLGYKGEVIKDYFLRYRERSGSFTINLETGQLERVGIGGDERWIVHLLDTGQDTMTGGRVKRAAEFLGDRRFLLTYGDGLADVDVRKIVECHERAGSLATITAVRPPARFGGLALDGDIVREFEEKPQTGEGWINGGFMVMEPEIAKYIEGDSTILERAPLERLADAGRLAAYRHEGFWQCMDTLRDLNMMRELWDKNPPWRLWQGGEAHPQQAGAQKGAV